MVDLLQRPRHHEPEEEPDYGRKNCVVNENADGARYAAAVERFDAWSHRRRECEREEEEPDDDLQLPEREQQSDNAHDDECRDKRAAGGLGHSRVISPFGEEEKPMW